VDDIYVSVPDIGNVYENVEEELNIYEFVPDAPDEATGRNHEEPANPTPAHGHGRECDFEMNGKT